MAGEDALSKGVTSFHDAGENFATIDFLENWRRRGSRRYASTSWSGGSPMRTWTTRLDEYLMLPEGNDFLTVRSIKRQVDGALGSHGAWLLEPYEDLETTGLTLEPLDDIMETARLAIKHGFQVNTHAIGDRGNREILDLYQRAFEEAGVDGQDPAVADRARPAPPSRRRGPLRRARRDPFHAGHPLHQRRALGLRAPRGRAGRERSLPVAGPHRLGGRREQRNRYSRGRRGSPPGLLRVRHPDHVRTARPSSRIRS